MVLEKECFLKNSLSSTVREEEEKDIKKKPACGNDTTGEKYTPPISTSIRESNKNLQLYTANTETEGMQLKFSNSIWDLYISFYKAFSCS